MRYTNTKPLTEDQTKTLFALNNLENERVHLATKGDYDAAKEKHAEREQLLSQLHSEGIEIEFD